MNVIPSFKTVMAGAAPAADYRAFLERKVRMAAPLGIEIADEDINPILKPHMRAIVKWAIRGGRRAIFAAFGLGKTIIQIEIVRILLAKTGGRGLTVLPLGVRQEFKKDVDLLATGKHPKITDAQRAQLAAWLEGHPERLPSITFIRSIEEAGATGHYMTNYETVRDGKLSPDHFNIATLDEASVLRSFGSLTYQSFLSLFANVRFRFVATATPSPNRFKELIHYAGFLGVMDTGLALTRFFQRDSEKAGNLTLFPHKEQEFWLWVASWGVFLQRPSDLGFSDEGYDLPELVVRWHEVEVNLGDAGHDRDGQGILFRGGARGLASEARERRETLAQRIEKMRAIVDSSPDDHFILWHDLEDERRAIETALPAAVSVYGSQDLDLREQLIVDFSDGKYRLLAGKPVMLGSGCNFQRHCHRAVFVGVNHKFNDFIQAIHRLLRFLQEETVEIDIIFAETERETVADIKAKWLRHNQLAEEMTKIIRKYGLNHDAMAAELTRAIGIERIEATGQNLTVANNDCVEEMKHVADNSLDLVVTSIPFSKKYEYCESYNDFGHVDDDEHFFEQMDFLTPELLRALKPGRLACIHIKDTIDFGAVTGLGFPTVNPLHAKTLAHFMAHGFAYMGLIFIDTDVVRENNQTYRLTYSELRKDGTKMGVGSPEFVLLMRKPQTDRSRGYADDPVQKRIEDYSLARWQIDAHARWKTDSNRFLTVDELAALPADTIGKVFKEQTRAELYNFESHVRIGEALAQRRALPTKYMALMPGSNRADVWDDVNRMLTLNGSQAARNLEKHVCPLQFDIVDRLITRYSEPGELVFDPFGGLFTVPYRALELGRRGRAAELNPGYFLDGVKHLEAQERKLGMPTLFDLMNATEEEAAS
ncbi:Superfamily II DNA/RNA helicases, SNF2 family [Devosia sp. DBB001]|nr:Superfamily II DNA/RNA helicases, SNF2 family [Devosia sp. DBB001]